MAITYLLDTNMFSYIATGASPAARAEFLRVSQDRDAVLCISVITEAEVRYGMAKHSLSHERRSAIEGLFVNLQILPWGSDEAAAYARAKAKLETQGITVALADMLIAAHGITTGAVFVTRDKVFSRVDDLDATANWATDI
jgi:tRNA(fMet)-specific endonuclease VapC